MADNRSSGWEIVGKAMNDNRKETKGCIFGLVSTGFLAVIFFWTDGPLLIRALLLILLFVWLIKEEILI